MEDKIICNECGTENEEKYEFCKNCGRVLKTEKTQQNPFANNAPYGQYANGYNGYMDMPEIEGIPTDEVAAFVGSKAPKIIPKFAKMQMTASKTSWCWSVAILSYLFGPMGAAFWFLYRKMYKIAIIFFAIGIVLSSASTFASSYSYEGETQGEEVETLDIYDAFDAYLSGEITLEEYYDSISGATAEDGVVTMLSNVLNIATLIITGIFAYHWYKKHMVKKVYRVRSANTDLRYYHFALSTVGGTSGGAVVAGVGICFAVYMVISVAAAMIFGGLSFL